MARENTEWPRARGNPEKRAGMLMRQRVAEAMEAVYAPHLPVAHVNEREDLYDFARAHIGDAPITYLEFGVKSGRSVKRMAARFKHPQAKFYGFDSFEGLPENWKMMEVGTFSMGGRIPETSDKRVSYVKGWFQNSLPEFLATHDLSDVAPLVVHYDADLYGSTLFVLAQLWDKTKEYYFVFDEFMQDEAVALYDFSRAYPIELEFYAQTVTSPFKQVFGRVKRVKFELKP